MGMDVTGHDPTSPEGEYFRRNIWCWHPLANLVCMLAPRLTAQCVNWHSNDADGLDAETSRKLARALNRALKNGHVAKLITKYEAALNALPDEICTLCGGTGIRDDEVGRKSDQPRKIIGTDTCAEPNHPRFGATGWCNGCNGCGKKRPFMTNYHCGVDDVADFARFLESCGGFEIC